MYINNIQIKNIGCIEKIYIQPSFSEDGLPQPVILVGENGTGKSCLLSSIIDSLYEMDGFISDLDSDNNAHLYYQTYSNNMIHYGEKYMYSIIDFSLNNCNAKYICKLGKVDNSEFKDIISDLKEKPIWWKENELSKGIICTDIERLSREYASGIIMIKDASFRLDDYYKGIDYTGLQGEYSYRKQKWLKSITNNVDNGLSDSCFLDVLFWIIKALDCKNNSVVQVINEIFSLLFYEKVRADLLHLDNSSRVQIVSEEDERIILPDINYLSTGQRNILYIFANILKRYSLIREEFKTKDIEGIAIIDEIDKHLHSVYQKEILPKLISLFPKIQFIISTHSPLFLLGLNDVFGNDGFEVIRMPDGMRIETERFSEFETIYSYVRETDKFIAEMSEVIKKCNKPVVFVEGETDEMYFNKALEVYGYNVSFEFRCVGTKNEKGESLNSGSGNLENAYKFLYSNNLNNRYVVLFDCDIDKQEEDKNSVYLRVMKKYDNDIKLKKGIENALIFNGLDVSAYYEKKEMICYIPNSKKMGLCKYLCDLDHDTLKMVFANLKNEINRMIDILS